MQMVLATASDNPCSLVLSSISDVISLVSADSLNRYVNALANFLHVVYEQYILNIIYSTFHNLF